MLLLVTIVACITGWVSWKIRRARAQRFAVQKLREQGNVKLRYDWQPSLGYPQPPRPQWLIANVGDEYFQEITGVYLSTDKEVAIDLAPLEEFPKLETLQVEDRFGEFPVRTQPPNKILPPTSLESLSDLRHLKNVSIVYLNDLDLTPLGKMQWLEQLTIVGDNVDISPLANLSRLNELNLHLSPFGELSPLEGMQSLEVLNLSGGSGSSPIDLSPIGTLSNLRKLSIEELRIPDLRPLGQLGNIQHLSLQVQSDTDLQPLANLNSLLSLSITTTKTKNDVGLEFLAELSELEELTLWGFQLNNLSVLTQLQSLEELSLMHINSDDWSVLGELPSLERLALDDCNIENISPLSAAASLEQLRLHSMNRNEWDDDQVKALQDALPNCKITW